MFDNVAVPYGHNSLKCKENHFIKVFQTKSLDNTMSNYYLVNNELWHQDDKFNENETVKDGILTKSYKLTKVYYTGEIEVHDYCEKCEPVYTLSQRKSYFADALQEMQPLFIFSLIFQSGELKDVFQKESFTRDEYKLELKKEGHVLLDDNDTIVKLHRKDKLK